MGEVGAVGVWLRAAGFDVEDMRQSDDAGACVDGGDVLIALSAIVLALLLFGNSEWPRLGAGRVLLAVLAFGIGYAIFSEWLNIEVRQAWAYRDIMPVIPAIDAGLSPFLQWLVIPTAGYLWAIRRLPWQTSTKSAHG